ncbi:MAG: tetratricopeptide repeat protein [Candidatus Omnitrophica bacterium]|nr:tetratricopeptide repeat protein [Candidatus Omnitrophota bacterium]
MKHKIPFELLSRYIDQRCSLSERERVESHLSECESCRKTALLLKNSNLVIRHADREKLSTAFDRAFNQKLHNTLKSREENRIGFIVTRVLQRTREVFILPSPMLARVVVTLLLFVSAYGVLTHLVVQPVQIVTVKGKVMIYSHRGRKWVKGTKGLLLGKDDTLTADRGSFADIAHANKYRIRIKQNSEIKIAKLLPKYVPGKTVYNLKKGKTLVHLSKKFKGSRFVMATPEATATALGTDFLVDVSAQPSMMTRLGVLNGRVKVVSTFRPEGEPKQQQVILGGGEATEVFKGDVPMAPRQLLEKEWQEMTEFYEIGEKVQVALLISNGKYRTRELLRPAPLYISDLEPKEAALDLMKAIELIDNAIKTKDRNKHLQGIRTLEAIMAMHPSLGHKPQIFLFIGAYYNYLGMPEKAIETFRKVSRKYPESTFASMALYATGIIYEEKLNNTKEAEHYYALVLRKYPKSPEAQMIRSKQD